MESGVYQCRHLVGKRLKIFLAAADRIIPADGDSPGGGTMLTAGVVDWAMARMPAGLRGQLLGFFWGLELMGFLFGGKPFTMNSDRAKDRELKWLEGAPLAPLRMGFFALKTYVAMGYYTREDVWKTIGYDGPILPERPATDPVVRALCQGRLEVRA